MKTFFLLFVLALINLKVDAQQNYKSDEHSKFYIGVGLTSVPYHIYYDEPQSSGFLTTGYFVPLTISVGHNFNQRASAQVGVAYGGSKDSGSWVNASQSGATTVYDESSLTRSVAVPVTIKFIFFNVHKRLPVYGTATLMPAWGFTTYKISETRNGAAPTTTTENYAGMNLFSTAGVGVNYKISQRLIGFVEVLPIKYNMTGPNSIHHDWEQYSTLPRRIYRSLNTGINYNFSLN